MPTPGPAVRVLRFEDFELDTRAGELRKRGVRLRLQGQPLQVLAALLNRAGDVVTREELRGQIWTADTFVDFDHSLHNAIARLREVLGDSSETPRFIETLPRRGYRFIGGVAPANGTGMQAGTGFAPVEQGAVPVETIPRRGYRFIGTVEQPSARLMVHDRVPEPAREKPSRRRWLAIALLVSIVAAASATLAYFHFRQKPILTEKDTIVIAGFANSTGDTVFDDTLKQGLAVELSQSPFLNILSDKKIAETLQMMGREGDEGANYKTAVEICQRTQSAAALTGSIAGLGSQYVIGLKAVNCKSGDLLAEAQEQAASKEGVLKALHSAAGSLRSKLGESLSTVQEYATPLADATTPSLEALKAYSLGQKTRSTNGDTASLPFFKRAVELDPNFAMAYRTLSDIYSNLSEARLAAEYARKAYELREKVSERERFSIEALYYQTVTGELEKAAQTYELWQQTYPRNYPPYANLGVISSILGTNEKALVESREALRLEPNEVFNYAALGSIYMSLNRLDEAEAVLKQAEERKLQSEYLFANHYLLAFLKSDAAQMERLSSAATGKPEEEELMLYADSDTQAWYGKLKNARELTRRAMDSAEHHDAKETAASYQAESALREAEIGNWEQARTDANAALKLAANRDVKAMAALALAGADDTAGAEKLAAELDKIFPLDTLVQRYWLPTVRAAVAMERKDPNRAVELLKAATAVELGSPTNSSAVLMPVHVRGEAYLALGDGNRAATEFQKFIDHRGLVNIFPWGALARLGLARAYAMQGDTAKARAAYQDFLTLWKDADPDIPVLKQAKAEYAKLQ